MKKANKKYSLTAKGFAAIRMSNERYRSLIKGKDTLTASQWLGICDLFSAKCAYCGSNKPLTVDHFVPLTKGGFLTAKNVLPACGSCNSSKGNKNPFEWLENIEEAYRNKIKHYLNEGHKSIELL
jgi:5-methylcytosine-specific restriction endonuclease McrA